LIGHEETARRGPGRIDPLKGTELNRFFRAQSIRPPTQREPAAGEEEHRHLEKGAHKRQTNVVEGPIKLALAVINVSCTQKCFCGAAPENTPTTAPMNGGGAEEKVGRFTGAAAIGKRSGERDKQFRGRTSFGLRTSKQVSVGVRSAVEGEGALRPLGQPNRERASPGVILGAGEMEEERVVVDRFATCECFAEAPMEASAGFVVEAAADRFANFAVVRLDGVGRPKTI
jgi:hypothetical protein